MPFGTPDTVISVSVFAVCLRIWMSLMTGGPLVVCGVEYMRVTDRMSLHGMSAPPDRSAVMPARSIHTSPAVTGSPDS